MIIRLHQQGKYTCSGFGSHVDKFEISLPDIKWYMLMHGHSTLQSEQESFQWSEVRRGVLDPRMWMSATAYFSLLSGMYSFGLFVRLEPSPNAL